MNKKYTNLSLKNIYKSKSLKSEVTSQIIYGENFLILKKFSKWLKIKTLNDNYIGFIINRKYLNIQKSSKKIFVLKSKAVSYTHLRAHETPEHRVFRGGV